jgi:hypothetical protein
MHSIVTEYHTLYDPTVAWHPTVDNGPPIAAVSSILTATGGI